MNDSSVCQVEKRGSKSYNNMEAIAYGVQARFEENTGYGRRLTDATVQVARAMGIPESEIEKWTAQRLTRMNDNRESLREIKRILGRLYGKSSVI